MVVYLSAFAIRCWETLSVTSVNWNLRPIFRSSLFLQIASAMRDSTRYLESPQISIKYWTTYYRLGLHLRQLEFIIKLSAGLLASSLDGVAARRLPASLYRVCFLPHVNLCLVWDLDFDDTVVVWLNGLKESCQGVRADPVGLQVERLQALVVLQGQVQSRSCKVVNLEKSRKQLGYTGLNSRYRNLDTCISGFAIFWIKYIPRSWRLKISRECRLCGRRQTFHRTPSLRFRQCCWGWRLSSPWRWTSSASPSPSRQSGWVGREGRTSAGQRKPPWWIPEWRKEIHIITMSDQ